MLRLAACLAVSLALAAPAVAAGLPGFTRIGTGPAGGTVWQGVIPGRGATARPSVIYLPPGFSTASRYRTVYLLHGLPGSPYSYVDSLQLARVADALPPFVAVVPAGGPGGRYEGEWAGVWEDYVVDDVVPWVDANLPTRADGADRALAGLSAGGYGAVDIGLRHPGVFGTLESWSGYFRPFRDGELKNATPAQLAAHDPARLVGAEAPALRRLGVRFFVSSGPSHGVVHEADTIAFARRLAALGLTSRVLLLPHARGMYADQLAPGLRYALAG